MDTRTLLEHRLHPSQTDKEPKDLFTVLCESRSLEEAGFATYNEVYRRLQKFQGRFTRLKMSLQIYHEIGDDWWQWSVLPKGVEVYVSGVAEPQTFLESPEREKIMYRGREITPQEYRNLSYDEIDKAVTFQVATGAPFRQIPRGADPVLELSIRSWINLAWFVTAKHRLQGSNGNETNGQVRTLELWYSLAPEEFIHVHEHVIPKYHLWRVIQEANDFHFAKEAWELFRSVQSRPYIPEDHYDCRFMFLKAQRKFNDLCDGAGICCRRLVETPVFARLVSDLTEAKIHWSSEFWGPTITSPMQAKVREITDQRMFTGKSFMLQDELPALSEEEAEHNRPIQADPEPTELPAGEFIRSLEPGKNVVVEGALSVRFMYAREGWYYADILELGEAIGVTFPSGFSSKDPWIDRPIGEARRRHWQEILKAVGMLERAEYEEITLTHPLFVKYVPGSPFVKLSAGERVTVGRNVHQYGFIVSFSYLMPFVDLPERTGVDVKSSTMDMERRLFFGMQKYRSVAYDIKDRDGMVAAARLIDLADLVKPGFIQKIRE